MSAPLPITDLLAPDAYPHPVERIDVRETHISWILLTGEFAYKIKKPVNFGFVDFSTLERRRFFCGEELRLNRRFAAELYLDVVPITSREGRLTLSGDGVPIEFAVKMRQFDDSRLLARLLADGRLTPAHIDELAEVIATFHREAARADEQSEWGTREQIGGPAFENFETLKPLISEPARLDQLNQLADWTTNSHGELSRTFDRRREAGFIRECHGDLHLGNVVLWQDRSTPFDCIEFNPSLRWTDVMNEIAFVIMDLDDGGRADLSARFLNAYLERTGDYRGLAVLPFYLVYRAVVRAKVDALRLQQTGVTDDERERLAAEWHGYLDLAERYTARRPTALTITHGLSGSGKTTGTQSFIEQHGAIRLRSDIERKRLFDPGSELSTAAEIDSGIYSPEASRRTYETLVELARSVLEAGFPVVVDATFLKWEQRRNFQKLADELGVPFQILLFEADENVLRERIQQRLASGNDASDATVDVLEHQLRTREPLTDEERTFVTTCS